jgi:hypothetical protein
MPVTQFKLTRPMVHVTCPRCSSENIGSALLCEHCQADLVGLQRVYSSEPPRLKPNFETFPYDFYAPSNVVKTMRLPIDHCSSCGSALPALTPTGSAGAIYTAAKIRPPTDPTNNYIGADLEVMSSFFETQGNNKIISTKKINFRFPLCNNCYYDQLVLKKYEPELYDPSMVKHPRRETLGFILFALGLLQLISGGLSDKFGIPVLWSGVLFFGSTLWMVPGLILVNLSKSYDKRLRAALEYDASMRYGEVKAADVANERRRGLDPNYLNSVLAERKYYHFKLLFRNQLYRDLFARKNTVDAPSTDPLRLEREKEKALQGQLIKEDPVRAFYQRSYTAYLNGILDSLNVKFKAEAENESLEDLIKKFPPYQGGALAAFFETYPPLEDEFLIGIGDLKTEKTPGWFVLTNQRLIQRDGRDNRFKEVFLADIDSYEQKAGWSGSMEVRLKSGEEISFKKILMLVSKDYLNWSIAHCQ